MCGPNVCKVQLRTCEILSRLQASAGTINPIILENCCANSAITQVSINSLCQDTSHISILGMEFTSQMSCGFQQMLTQVKSIKCFILHPSESQAQFIGAINCTWNPISGYLTSGSIDFLSHVKIFYWKSSCIELYMELCCERAIHSDTSDIPHPAFGIKSPQSFIMAPLHNNDHNNLPNVSIAFMRAESPEVNAALDDEADSTIDTTEATCKDGSFRIKLNSAQLYSIIKEGLVGTPYPEAFKMTVPVSDCEFTVLLKVFPLKSRSEHISIWAEVTAPPYARGQVMLQVTAFDPRKEQRLGHTIECTEKLKRSDSGDYKKAKFTLDEVMLHVLAFYKIPDVELCISITVS